MPAYAKVEDVQARMTRALTEAEQKTCKTLLEDAGVLIDACKRSARADAKKLVSCRIVMRVLGDGENDAPIGANQGSVSALGYSQSWTMSGGGVGEIYLSKADKLLLGAGNAIGSHSPLENICDKTEVFW